MCYQFHMPGINVKTTPQPATTINNNDQPCVFVAGEKKKQKLHSCVFQKYADMFASTHTILLVY